MTITPEQRAMRVTDAILDFVMVDGENVSASVLHPATDIIASAIREAENAVLERAIEAVKAGLEGSFDEHDLFLAATDRIRSLKHKDT